MPEREGGCGKSLLGSSHDIAFLFWQHLVVSIGDVDKEFLKVLACPALSFRASHPEPPPGMIFLQASLHQGQVSLHGECHFQAV